jgi:hypothetical protein
MVREEHIMQQFNGFGFASIVALAALAVLALMCVPGAQGGAGDAEKIVPALARAIIRIPFCPSRALTS